MTSKKLKKHRIVLVVASIALGVLLSGCKTPLIRSIREVEPTTEDAAQEIPVQTTQISFSETGFSPKLVEVVAETEVQFENIGQTPQTIASDPHPDHNYLLDLYSRPIYPGEKYYYTFKSQGRWAYHLEANPSIRGEIIVE